MTLRDARDSVRVVLERWMGKNYTQDYPLAAQETDKILDEVFGESPDSMAHLSEDYAEQVRKAKKAFYGDPRD